MKRKFVFCTLNELLIILAIVGIIAILAIPPIIQEINKTLLTKKWQKTYIEFSEITKKLAYDNDWDFTNLFGTDINAHDNFRKPFLKYLSYTKLCNAGSPVTKQGCWHETDKWYLLSGTRFVWGNKNFPKFSRVVLKNGTFVVFRLTSPDCSDRYASEKNSCGNIYFDINGYKEPNIVGKDIFAAMLLKNGKISPFGVKGDNYNIYAADYSCNINIYPYTYGWNCSSDKLADINE